MRSRCPAMAHRVCRRSAATCLELEVHRNNRPINKTAPLNPTQTRVMNIIGIKPLIAAIVI